MARFLVTSGAKFTPFNYDELVKPLAQMAEAHANTQTALDTMAMEAGAIGAQIGNGDDTARSRALYDNYMKQLQSTADELYQRGYGAASVRGLSKARAMYGSDIGKIQQAIKQRDARADEYRKAVAANPTLITEYNPLNKGLDNWLDNPQYGYYQSYSGEMLINQGKLVGDNLRKEMLEKEQDWRPILGGQYYERIIRNGFSSGELNQALDNVMNGTTSDNPAIAALQQAIGNIYASSGMGSWADGAQRQRALSYIGQGMSAAVGEQKIDTQANRAYSSPLEWANYNLRVRQQQLEEAKAAAKANAEGDGFGFITPTQPVTSKPDMADRWAKEYSKTFDGFKNGPKTVKTPDGRTLPVRTWQEATSLVYNGRLRNEGYEEFGFDVAMDPLDWFHTSGSRLYGKTTLGGQEYTIRTGPAKEGGWKSGMTNEVGIYVEDRPGHWAYHEQLSNDYNRLHKEIMDTADYYKKNYREVYTAALSPEKEKKLREKYSVSPDAPTIGLVDAIDASPSTTARVSNEVILAQSGPNGKAMREQLAAQLKTNYDSLKEDLSGREIKNSPTYGIRKIENNYIPSSSKKSDRVSFDKAFTTNNQGEIDNINEIRVTPESIQEGVFLVKTTKGSFAVPVQMFGSEAIAYQQHMKQLGSFVSSSINNAGTLMYAPDNDSTLVTGANILSQVLGVEVTPAMYKQQLSTREGREQLIKWYQDSLISSVPVYQTSILRASRFPAGSLTASKDPE